MERQFNHREVEKKIRQWWATEQVYTQEIVQPEVVQPKISKPATVTIDTPPPTVSGSLHIGHIFSYTQTDIAARIARMSGNAVFYPFGFDDNGLPTERFIEKKCGVSAHQLGRSAFIDLCLKETGPVEASFKELWEQMGLSVDWRSCYQTIGTQARALSQASFITLYKKGHIYRRDELSLFCTTCRTTVAQAELDDLEQKSTFYHLNFADAKGRRYTVATTRPELLPACVAVLYHPSDSRYSHLEGSTLQVPLFSYEVPVIADESVIPDKGTGLVMCCTFGDTTDITWYKKYALPYRPVIGPDGRWLSNAGVAAGKQVREARAALVGALLEAGLITESVETTHVVNVHERCRTPIEFLVLPQWFLRILPYKKELIACADHIQWHPAFMKTRYINWVEQITWDWCLSRQRFFGIPFPVWHCTACKAVLFPELSQLPLDPQETAWDGPCTQCGGGPVVPDRDVMDTWNTSSLTPYLCEMVRTSMSPEAILTSTSFTPMTIRPQAHDIIRTWAFYTIAKVWMHHGTVPWRHIVISGHVVSGAGGKLSKSKNNSFLSPEQLLEQYPVDAIRAWTASGTLGQDVAFSEAQLALGNRLLVKLWNAFTFIKERTTEQTGLSVTDLSVTDRGAFNQSVHRWMLHTISACAEQYAACAARFEIGLALQTIDSCFWGNFCDTYLELIKDQFFNPDRYTTAERTETCTALRTIGLRILQLYAPFLPYITEEIYQQLFAEKQQGAGSKSIHETRFSELQAAYQDEDACAVLADVQHIVHSIRRLKTEQKCSLKTELTLLTIFCHNTARAAALETELRLIAGATRSQEVRIIKEASTLTDQLQGAAGAWEAHVVLTKEA